MKNGGFMKKKRIILYARESTKWQAEEGYNLESQKKRMLSYINSYYDENTCDIEIFEEAGKSAKDFNRPMMEKMLQRIENNTVDIICVYCIDRLTRSVRDMADFLDKIQKKKVTLLSVTEKIDTSSPQGRFFLNILGSMAQLERENISERVLRALKESAEQGNYAKSSIPFGYIKNKETKQLEIEKNAAEAIKYIFHEIGKNNKSASQITKELRESNRFNRQWSDSHIYRIIKNKIYCGTYVTHEKEIENHTIPIVSKEEWQLANDCLYRKDRDHKNKYIYKGLCFCDECNRIMSCTCGNNKKKNKRYLYYECYKCKSVISEENITKYLNDSLTFVMRKSYYNQIISQIPKIDNKSITSIFPMDKVMYDSDYEHELKIKKLTNRISEEHFELLLQTSYILQKLNFSSSSIAVKKRIVRKEISKIHISKKKIVSIERNKEKK